MTTAETSVEARATDVERPRAARLDARVALAATAVALLPVFAAVITYAGRELLPGGDIALIELRVRDVFGPDLPLAGPYSRYGWNHPGPLFFYALAPLDAVAGGAAWATLVSGAVLQGVAIALGARLAWVRGGVFLTLLVTTAITLAAVPVGDRLFTVPWNPHVALPFFALFLLQIWSVTVGDRWQLLGTTIVGTFLVQTHVGYAPLVAVAVAWCAITIALDARRGGEPLRQWRAPVTWSAIAGIVLWLPPIVQELTQSRGNLSALVRFARSDGGVGIADGAGVLAGEFRLVPPWLGGDEPQGALTGLTDAVTPSSLWWLLVPVALAVLGLVAARRAGERGRAPFRLLVLLVVLCVAAVPALARVDPPLESYLFLWRALLATLLVSAVVWAVLVATGVELRGFGGAVSACVLGAALLVSSAATTRDVIDPPVPVNPFASPARSLLRQIDDHVPREPFIVRNVAGAQRGIGGTVFAELDREGAPVRADRDEAQAFGEHRTIPRDRASEVWFVAEEGRDVSLLTALEGARVVARTTPLDPASESELVRLQRRLAEQLRAAGRPDLVEIVEYSSLVPALADVEEIAPRDVRRLSELTRRAERAGTCRCAVIAFDPDAAPAET